MAYGLIHRLRVDSGIEAIVNVQANPGVTVTLIGSDKTAMFTAVADSTTGLAAITVNIPDTYTIGTDISADSFAEGNTTSIDISESKTYSAQFIKLNKGYTECGCTNAYKSNSLLVWWNGTKPTEYFSGWYCIDTDDNSEVTGEGDVYQISSSISYRGFLKDVASGTTKTYKVGSYITVNGTNYYSAADTVTGTAKTISLNSFVKYTSSQTITVPEGCHSITAYCVGGGGAGGDAGYMGGPYVGLGGGGGGGGRVLNKTMTVLPGQNITITIGGGGSGNGGAGGTTTVAVNNQSVAAPGGGGGGGSYANGWYIYLWGGGSGGSGGGEGMAAASGSGSAWYLGGTGGSNGGGGGSVTYHIGSAIKIGQRSGPGSGQHSTTQINGITFAGGGGGGGAGGSAGNATPGGAGGGGAGGNVNGVSGTANTGGGGGGGGSIRRGGSHGNGGSGVAFITFNAA